MRTRTRWGCLIPGWIVVLGFAMEAEPLRGQASELAEVRSALDAAQYTEARTLLEAWWDRPDRSTDRRTQQEGLWLRARLTPDPQMAELDYRRLVIEFPGGPFSDGALLRLAQGAEARGEASTARRYLEILVRDYPTSEHRVEARDRMARLPAEDGAGPGGAPVTGATPDPGDPPVTGDPPGDPPPVLAPPTGIRNDSIPENPLRTPPPAPDSVAPDPVPDVPVDTVAADPPEPEAVAPPASEMTGEYTVQLGAFSSRERAADLADRALGVGLVVRIVQVEGSALYRVRLGGFPTREAAERAAEEPRRLGLEALVSADREAETTP